MDASGSEEQSTQGLRVLLIAEKASYQCGGEAVLQMNYISFMRPRRIPAWIILKERNRAEMSSRLWTEALSHIPSIPDPWHPRSLAKMKNWKPSSVASFSTGQTPPPIDN